MLDAGSLVLDAWWDPNGGSVGSISALLWSLGPCCPICPESVVPPTWGDSLSCWEKSSTPYPTWDPIANLHDQCKGFRKFNTAASIGIIFLIDLAVGELPFSLANISEPQFPCFRNFKLWHSRLNTLDFLPSSPYPLFKFLLLHFQTMLNNISRNNLKHTCTSQQIFKHLDVL